MGAYDAGLSASEAQAAQQALEAASNGSALSTELAAPQEGSQSEADSAADHNADAEEAPEAIECDSSAGVQNADDTAEDLQEEGPEQLLKWDRPMAFR